MSQPPVPGAASAFLDRSDFAVSFADPSLPDSPLTYVNPAFCRLVGYGRGEIVGRNCRFLQGEGTDPEIVNDIRRGIRERSFTVVPIANYRSDGEPFRNGLLIGPVDGAGEAPGPLFGMQWDVDLTLELRRRARDAPGWSTDDDVDLQMRRFAAIVERVSTASGRGDGEDSSVPLVERLVAVTRPQRYPPHGRLPNWTRSESLLRYLFEPYAALTGYPCRLEGDSDIVAVDVAHALALAVHELSRATGCLGEAGLAPRVSMSCDAGVAGGEPVVDLDWRTTLVDADGGEPGDGLSARARDGLRILGEVVEAIGGRFEHELGTRAIEARVRLPNRPVDSPGVR